MIAREELTKSPLPPAIESRREGGLEIASLRADSRHEEPELRMRAPQLGHLLRTRGADHQHQISDDGSSALAARCATRR